MQKIGVNRKVDELKRRGLLPTTYRFEHNKHVETTCDGFNEAYGQYVRHSRAELLQHFEANFNQIAENQKFVLNNPLAIIN